MRKLKLGLFVLFTVGFFYNIGFASVAKEKVIALTFDDGPSKIYTNQVLEILKNNNVKATFFVVGSNVKKYPDKLQKTFAAGHVIGNHSYTHPNFTKISKSEIESELTKTNELIYREIHLHPILLRPPFGATCELSRTVARTLGYRSINWDFLINDYDVAKVTPTIIANKIIQHATPGAVIVMHDGGGNREKTVAALPKIIAELKKRGYRFVTVPEILHINAYREQS